MFQDTCKRNVMKQDIGPAQLRAARALVDWSREQLADVAHTTTRTLARFEAGQTDPRPSTLAAIRTALETAGVVFTNVDEPGVKLRKSDQ